MTTVDIAVTTGVGADTIVYNVGANNNYGAWNLLQVLESSSKIYTLMRFDLSSIPSTATCTAATLTLTSTNNTGSLTYNIYKITDANGDWTEGAKNAAAAGAGEPCWNYKAYNTVNWAGSAGLLTAGTDYVDTVIATVTSAKTTDTGMGIPFNADGLAVLQSWFGDATNNGLLIKDTVTTANVLFHSGEASTESYRPKLTVTYTAAATGNPHYYYAQL